MQIINSTRGRAHRLSGASATPRRSSIPAAAVVVLAAAMLPSATVRRVTVAQEPSPPAPSQAQAGAATRVDLYGDPLPAGALARLGTVRFRDGLNSAGVGFARDGQTLISATEQSGIIRFWETRTGRLLKEISVPGERIQCFHVSPDGRFGACAGYRFDEQTDGLVCSLTLWNLGTGRQEAQIEWASNPSDPVGDFCFSPHGASIVAGTMGGMLRYWDLATRKQLLAFKMPERGLRAIAVSPEGDRVAVALGGGIYVFRWPAGIAPAESKWEVDGNSVTNLAFSPDGTKLAIGADDRDGPWLCDLERAAAPSSLRAAGRRCAGQPLVFSPDGRLFSVTSEGDQFAVLWKDEKRRPGQQLDLGFSGGGALAISRDGRYLAAAGEVIRVWDLTTGKRMAADPIGHRGYVYAALLSPDGQTAFTAGGDGQVGIWDARTGANLHMLRHGKGHWGLSGVRGLAVSPDGKWIASSSHDNTVRLWNAATGQQVYRLPGHGEMGGSRPVAFSADGERFASWGDCDAYLRVWDLKTGKAVAEHAIRPSDAPAPEKRDELEPPRVGGFDDQAWNAVILDAAFSPNAELFGVTWGRNVYVFDVRTGKQRDKIETEANFARFAFSADARRIALLEIGRRTTTPEEPSDSESVTLRVVDLSSGRELWSQRFPEFGPWGLAFSHDGSLLAVSTRSPQGEIRVLDAATGKQRHRIEDVPGIDWTGVPSFSRDGKRLACPVRDCHALVWDLSEIARSTPQ